MTILHTKHLQLLSLLTQQLGVLGSLFEQLFGSIAFQQHTFLQPHHDLFVTHSADNATDTFINTVSQPLGNRLRHIEDYI